MSDIQTATENMFRRTAVVILAQSAAYYQPFCADDAVNIRNIVTELLDNEIDIAGDNGEDATFQALRQLRSLVVQDLNAKGASLPQMKTYEFGASLPAPVVALRLYRDPGRADEVIMQTGTPHPAFQPNIMTLLSA